MKVAVIIVTYNAEPWLDRCFSSLRTSSVPLTTIVVDNLSKDNTVERLRRDYSEVQLICNDHNSGFGQANNIGMRVALEQGADYMFLLNQDAWIFENTIAELITVAQANPQAGIISPVHLTASEQQLDSYFESYVAEAGLHLPLPNRNDLPQVMKIDYVNAAAWLLPRHTIETVGGFDPLFFHYGEDNNYAHRVLFHGLCTLIATRSLVVHDRHGAPRAMNHDYGWFKNYPVVAFSDINHSILSTLIKTAPFNLKMLWRLFLAVIKSNSTAEENIKEGYARLFWSLSKIKKSRQTNCRPGKSWL